jgi:hypothetical protein
LLLQRLPANKGVVWRFAVENLLELALEVNCCGQAIIRAIDTF